MRNEKIKTTNQKPGKQNVFPVFSLIHCAPPHNRAGAQVGYWVTWSEFKLTVTCSNTRYGNNSSKISLCPVNEAL